MHARARVRRWRAWVSCSPASSMVIALRIAAALAAALPFSSASLISAAVISLSLNTSMLQLRSVLFAMAAPAAGAAPRGARAVSAGGLSGGAARRDLRACVVGHRLGRRWRHQQPRRAAPISCTAATARRAVRGAAHATPQRAVGVLVHVMATTEALLNRIWAAAAPHAPPGGPAAVADRTRLTPRRGREPGTATS